MWFFSSNSRCDIDRQVRHFIDTKMGVWFYNKVDSLYNWAAKRYNVKLLTDEEKRMAKFPALKARLEKIEKQLGIK